MLVFRSCFFGESPGARPVLGILASLVLLALLALLAPPPAAAGEASSAPAAAVLHRLRAEAGDPVRVERHKGTSRIRTMKGRLSPPGEGSPAAAAGRFLKEKAALFGLQPDAADLTLESQRESPAGTHLAYRQTHGGLPVFNGGVEVTLDRERRVSLVNSEYVPTDGLDVSPAVSAEEAVTVARVFAPAGKPSSPPQLGVFLVDGAPCLAWRFVLEAKTPFAVVEFTVDAQDGRVLERRDLVQELSRDGWGTVFSPNPVNALSNTALRDNLDADGPLFTPAYRKVRLRRLTLRGSTGRYLLRGPYVNISDARERPFEFPATKGVVSSKTGNFFFGRASGQFEHVMCYYHIDANQRYIQGLGFFNVNNRPIKVDPHGLAGADRSHYVANPVGAGYLAFGTGRVDDAEDADVILHEYAHALQDNQAPGKYLGTTTEAGAMGEGFADYWAASSTYDRSVLSGFDPACVGEWDRAPGCRGRVDGSKHYPEDMVGNADKDGELWAAALWDLFLSTADRGAIDKIILQSHFLVPANPTFKDGGEAILAADAALFAGRYQGNICQVMHGRGILVAGCGFTATVTWDNPLVDLDLRLRPPGGAGTPDWDYANDCSSYNPNPNWGTPSLDDNPLLKFDCSPKNNCTIEQIALKKFTTPGRYDVLVHYYERKWDAVQTTTEATVKVYLVGELLYSGTMTLFNVDNYPYTGDLWKVLSIDVVP